MLRKNLTASESSARIRKLSIKRTYVKNADEVKLYELGTKIVNELEKEVLSIKRERSVNFYYGAEEFLQYLKKILSEYSVEDDKIVNTAQKSSGALVSAIQLIEKAKEQLTDEIAQQIHNCTRVIAKYGNKEQKRIFNKIIGGDNPKHMTFFCRQLQNFVSCFDD